MRIRSVALSSLVVLFTSGAAAAQDPREGLDAGLFDAGNVSHGLVHTATLPKPSPFNDPDRPGNIAFLSTDVAFKGDVAFVGNFNGFLVHRSCRRILEGTTAERRRRPIEGCGEPPLSSRLCAGTQRPAPARCDVLAFPRQPRGAPGPGERPRRAYHSEFTNSRMLANSSAAAIVWPS
jgi:hypothetical protein